MSDLHNIFKQSICRLVQKKCDRVYIIDLNTVKSIEHSSDFTELKIQPYEDWLTSFATGMSKEDAINFFSKMNLTNVVSYLNIEDTCYIVYCRKIVDGNIQEYKLTTFYNDEYKKTLCTLCERLADEYPQPLKIIDKHMHYDQRFRFLASHLTEDFIEIRVKTGECVMFSPDNDMPVYSTLKEQIKNWAEDIIIPEEREGYINEYDIENLMSSIYKGKGYHNATYTAIIRGAKRSLSISSTLVREPFGMNEEYIFAYAQDVTALKEQKILNKQLVDVSQQLLAISQTDALTGLYNRTACERMIEKYFESCSPNNVGTMLLIDIDCFKNFNDQYGHQTGDAVLCFLSQSMRDVFRSDDIICRWGGDEFVVFMYNIHDENNIRSRVERLRIRLRNCPKKEIPTPITISIGGATAKKNTVLKSLFDACDKSLYQVKAQGRDGYIIDYTL